MEIPNESRLLFAILITVAVAPAVRFLFEMIYVICNKELFQEYVRTQHFPRYRLFFDEKKKRFSSKWS